MKVITPTASIKEFLQNTTIADPDFGHYVEWMQDKHPKLAHYPLIELIRIFVHLKREKDNG